MAHRVLSLVAGLSLCIATGCGNRVVSSMPDATPTADEKATPTPTPDPADPTEVAQPDRGGPVPCFNDGPYTLQSGNAGALADAVRDRAAELGIAIPGSGIPIRRSTNASGGSFRWTNLGVEQLTTLTEVCRILGYQEYVSSDCYDGERSGTYPNGKCNYHSTGDNFHVSFDGATWHVIDMGSGDKYTTTWLTSITCDASICESGE